MNNMHYPMTPDCVAVMLKEGARQLSQHGIASAAIDARVLLSRHCGMDTSQLLSSPESTIDDSTKKAYYNDIMRRLDGEPIAYIIGRREFMGLDFITTPAALIPRPETEELTETALAHILPNKTAKILDLGAGCGVIGLSISRLRPNSEVMLVDCSKEALALAKKNSEHLQTIVNFCESDWFGNINDAPFDYIISNPPYIADNDDALQHLKHEPSLALCGGCDGLKSLQIIIRHAPSYLRAGGILMVEHGHNQKNDVRLLFARAGFCGIVCLSDLAGLPRITLGVRPR